MSGLAVMQIVSDLGVGGAQEVVRTLAENLAERGCTQVVCTFRDGILRPKIEALGIPVIVLPERRSTILAFPFFLREMLAIRRTLLGLVDQYGIQIIQTHLLRSLDFLILTLRLHKNLKIFWTFHNARFDLREDHLGKYKWLLKPKRFSHHLLYRWNARWVSGLIAVSEEVKTAILETMAGIPRDKIFVICNGVDLQRYQNQAGRASTRGALGLAESTPVMAVVATFKKQKGHCYLIEAAASVVPQFPDLRILLIGEGELREELAAQTRELGLERNIHFLGQREDVAEILAASDFFGLPSLWEGLPMALVEAMASGLPVIATQVAGTQQVMIHGETGFLVPPGDTGQLSQAMIEMLSDPLKARAMGRTARRRVEQFFSARQQARQHISLYEQALKTL